MAEKESLSAPPQYNTDPDTDAAPPPPDISNIHGFITISAEWEERKAFTGVKICQHTETWSIAIDANNYHIVAKLGSPPTPSLPAVHGSKNVNGELLPYYFTVHTEQESKDKEAKAGGGKKLNKFILWSENNVVPGPLHNFSQQIRLDRKYSEFHLALGLIQRIIDCPHGTRFTRVTFPWQKMYKRAKTDWQWYGGYWMEGMAENWWDASKDVSNGRAKLRTKATQGKVVWRVRSENEMMVPYRWDVAFKDKKK